MNVLLERPSEFVALLRMNRPEKLNTLNYPTRVEIADHFAALSKDDSVRCIVMTGDERAFVAGADVNEFADVTTSGMTHSDLPSLWEPIARCPKPVIAAVNGYALGGGCELAMHADIIIAGEGAKFGQPEIRVGIMPGGGATQRLPRAVGKFKAMRILLTGEHIPAADAYTMGLVSEVVPDAEVLQRALGMADTIAKMPPLSARRIKEAVLAGADCSLTTGIMLERRAFDTLFDTEDQKEGVRAFAEKRAPNFKGK